MCKHLQRLLHQCWFDWKETCIKKWLKRLIIAEIGSVCELRWCLKPSSAHCAWRFMWPTADNLPVALWHHVTETSWKQVLVSLFRWMVFESICINQAFISTKFIFMARHSLVYYTTNLSLHLTGSSRHKVNSRMKAFRSLFGINQCMLDGRKWEKRITLFAENYEQINPLHVEATRMIASETQKWIICWRIARRP